MVDNSLLVSNTHSSNHFEKFKKLLKSDPDKPENIKKAGSKIENNNKDNPKSSDDARDSTRDSTDSNSKVHNDSQSDDDDDDEDDEDEYDDDIDEVMVSRSNFNEESQNTTAPASYTPMPRNAPKYNLKNRQSKYKPSKRFTKPQTIKAAEGFELQGNAEFITEALLVYSTTTVVWQDGTVEYDVPSTSLYPIHHLDNHEFFPGDFVVIASENSDISNFRDYGVIQKVDHHGRIAVVKWFTTYTSTEEPIPKYNGENEVSVYDLKDHPDFQYRPGTMVIRVANFVGEDSCCTTGQIIDNFVDGQVKVWWVEGHTSMCWPQDLFEVGQQDQADWGQDSESESWETESENSEIGETLTSSPKLILESNIVSTVKKVREAIARLEELFMESSYLQNMEVLFSLLSIYKNCRCLDRLINSNYFHEYNFTGLIERVRRGTSLSVFERAKDRKNRLFSQVQTTSPPCQKHQQHQQIHYQAIVSVNGAHNSDSLKEYAPKVLFNLSSTPLKSSTNSNNSANTGVTSPENCKKTNVSKLDDCDNTSSLDNETEIPSSLANEHKDIINEKNELIDVALSNIEKAFEETTRLNMKIPKDDSGNFTRSDIENGSTVSVGSSPNDPTPSLPPVIGEHISISCCSIELTESITPETGCVQLCKKLKEQLTSFINDVREKYRKQNEKKNSSGTDANESDEPCTLAEAKVNTVEVHFAEEVTNLLKTETGKESTEESTKDSKTKDSDTKHSDKDSGSSDEELVDSKNSTDQFAWKNLTSPISSPIPSPVADATLEHFQMLPTAPNNHKYYGTVFHPNNPQKYNRAVQREHRMLRNSLPTGVWVRVFEDRMDLLSVMIEGPAKTPYEDAMFHFDIQLGRDYPKNPPVCHYISYCTDRLNPNLYEDGKVCVSLLGTWTGRDTEMWGPSSTLLQVIVSIQGLILVPEPYFNEAGYEKQKGTQQGKENSRMYNEMAIIKVVQATTKMIQNPPDLFRKEILEHFQHKGFPMISRIKRWIDLSTKQSDATAAIELLEEATKASPNNDDTNDSQKVPGFPLIPASRGFCLTLSGLIDAFESKLSSVKSTVEESEIVEE